MPVHQLHAFLRELLGKGSVPALSAYLPERVVTAVMGMRNHGADVETITCLLLGTMSCDGGSPCPRCITVVPLFVPVLHQCLCLCSWHMHHSLFLPELVAYVNMHVCMCMCMCMYVRVCVRKHVGFCIVCAWTTASVHSHS